MKRFLVLLVPFVMVYAMECNSQTFVELNGVCFHISDNHTASVERFLNATQGSIPERIDWQGEYYAVNAIASHAFYCNFAMKQLVIPSTVKNIAQQAFVQCRSLRHLYLLCIEPPVADNNSFDGIDEKRCVLHVPYGTLQAYKKSIGWNRFKKIKEGKKP